MPLFRSKEEKQRIKEEKQKSLEESQAKIRDISKVLSEYVEENEKNLNELAKQAIRDIDSSINSLMKPYYEKMQSENLPFLNKKDSKNVEARLDEIEKSLLTTLKENLNSMIEKEAPRINDVLSTRIHENSQDEYFIKKSKKIASAATSLTKHNAIAAELKASKHIGKLSHAITREHNKAVLKDVANDIRGIKSDFIEENKQISQQNRQKAQERRKDMNTSPNSTSYIESLKSLKDLLDAGILTQEEFDTEKAKILNNN